MSAGTGTGTGTDTGTGTGAGGVAPYRSKLPPARDGFWQLLRAEFTKLRSVDRWLLTLLAGVVRHAETIPPPASLVQTG